MQTQFNFLDADICNEVQTNIVRNARKQSQEIARAWLRYATTNKLKHNTKKRHEAQFTFLSGVVAVLGSDTPALISLCFVSGRDLETVIEVGTSYEDSED